MKFQFLLFCFLTVVAFVETQLEFFTVHLGEDFRNIFKSFTIKSENAVMYLCRSPCRQKDVLIEAHGERTKSGRYNLRLENQADLHVAITQVIKQDAGMYRVGVSTSTSEEHLDFQLVIKDLCDGGVTMHRNQEYSVSKGSDLEVTCDIALQAKNRKFLCRGECSSFLIDTNDLEGYSAKYGVKYVSYDSFNVTIYNVSARDSGQYCCGVGREDSPNMCQQFTVRIDEGTGLALPIITAVLVGIILTLAILLVRKWKKTQAPDYVNSVPYERTSPADRESQPASCDGDPAYASLNPETRENVYDPLEFQKVNEDTERHYARVY